MFAQDVADCLDDAFPASRSEAHLSRLKDALLLYINAKYVWHIKFRALEPRLAELGVGVRSVNGAWGLVRDALKVLGDPTDSEARAVATHLIQTLTSVPKTADLTAWADDFLHHGIHPVCQIM